MGWGEDARWEEWEGRKNQINRRTWRIRGWSASREEKRIAREMRRRRETSANVRGIDSKRGGGDEKRKS